MNNLLLTRQRIKKAERLHAAQLTATKNGLLIYKRSAFEERQKQNREEVAANDS